MEQFLSAQRLSDEAKVQTAVMYFDADAKLWWRTRSDEVGMGKCSIGTWEQLKAELKAQFLPGNVSWMAHHSLMNLRQTGAVRDYIKEFSALMLDIKDMSDEDRFFHFLKGLQPWEQA